MKPATVEPERFDFAQDGPFDFAQDGLRQAQPERWLDLMCAKGYLFSPFAPSLSKGKLPLKCVSPALQ